MIESLAHAQPIYTYISVFVLMLSNGITSFPSSQFLYIFTGYLSSYGTISSVLIIVLGACGNAIGNIIQYELVRSKGVAFATRYFSVKEHSFEKLNTFVTKHGVWYLLLGKLIPGLKVAVPLVAGLTKISRIIIYTILIISSLIWAIIFVHIGLFFGTHSSITKWYTAIAILITFSLYIYSYIAYPHLFRDSPEEEKAK
jgi:membrane protein DedA with SNARE-associated domain